MSEAISENQDITVVVGHFEPLTGVEDAELESIVARYAPQVPLSGGSAEYELLVRLKVSATETGMIVARAPGDRCGTMLLVARSTSPAKTAPEVDILTAVHVAARSDLAHLNNERCGVARIVPEEGALTRRETQVLEHLSRGHTNRQIANALHISVDTVATHVTRIFRKLGVRKRQDLLEMRVPDSKT